MEVKLSILGCGSAAPSLQRGNSAQILEIAGKVILIDCGEGTQLQMLKYKISAYKIDIIFISHLHGDHFFGLPGLLTTLALYGRKTPLKIIGPKGLKKLLFNNFTLSEIPPTYEISIIEIKAKQPKIVLKDHELDVLAIPLEHRISCYGYHFQYRHTGLKLEKERCDEAKLGITAIRRFMQKLDYRNDDKIYSYRDFTSVVKISKSYTYISDTLFLPHLADFFIKTDILYHESTYLNNLLDKAVKTYHSTALQAGEMAKLCDAGLLILGHFSARYTKTDALLTEALNVFPETVLAEDGKVFVLK